MTTIVEFDPKDLEAKVKAMYRDVAERPEGAFHFEMGRALAERLGYAPTDLDRVPAEAILRALAARRTLTRSPRRAALCLTGGAPCRGRRTRRPASSPDTPRPAWHRRNFER